jgi:hypothetical protein
MTGQLSTNGTHVKIDTQQLAVENKPVEESQQTEPLSQSSTYGKVETQPPITEKPSPNGSPQFTRLQEFDTKLRKCRREAYVEMIANLGLDFSISCQIVEGWLNEMLEYAERAYRARWYSLGLHGLAIAIGLLAGLITVLDSSTWSGKSFSDIFGTILGGASVVLVAVIAVERLFHWREHWVNFGYAERLLRLEGSRFFLLSGSCYDSKTHAEAVPAFIDRVGQIRSRTLDKYHHTTEQTRDISEDGR